MTILYCRKSSESEDRQVLSIESQTNTLTELAQREGLSIDKIYIENMSAKEPGRPVFKEMVDLINTEKNCTLLVWKLDRLARNPKDEGEIKYSLQKEYIKKIITPFSTYLPSDNVLLAAFEFGMANQYIRDLSVNVKRGNKTKLEKGGWTGKAPYGYLNDRANKTIITDPINAPVVLEVFELFATGAYSLRDLSRLLYAKGRRNSVGNKMHPSLLYRILAKSFYTGLMIHNNKTYQGSHQPLVNKEIFDRCQELLNPNRSRKQKHTFPLRGYMSCAECGCALTATTKKGRYDYYYCTNGKKVCSQHHKYIKAEYLDELVAEKLGALQFDEELIEIAYQASKEKRRNSEDLKIQTLDQIQNQLKNSETKQEKLLNLFLSESIAEETYNAKNEILKREHVAIKNQYSQLSKKNFEGNATLELTKKAFLTANYARKDYLTADKFKKLEIAKTLLWNFSVKDQKIQSFQLKMPFQIMALGSKNFNIFSWQPHRESNPDYTDENRAS